MVVLYHYTVIYDRNYGHEADFWFSFELGRTGVELFFIISGFVIFMTLDRVQSSADFVRARVSRLYPTYWFSVLLTASAVTLFSLSNHLVSPGQVLVNLTMLQTFLGVSNVDGVYWTLALELVFYAWILLAFRLGLTKRIEATLLGWVAVPVTVVVLLSVFGIQRSWALASVFLLYHGHLFAAGILFNRMRTSPSRLGLFLLGLTFVVEAALRPQTCLVLALWYGLFVLLITGRLAVLNRRPLLFLGSISYPLYLLHENLGFIVIRQLYRWRVDDTLVLVLVPLAVSIALATAVHHLVELPAQRAMRRWARRLAPRDAVGRLSQVGRAPSAVTTDPAYNAGHIPDSAQPSEEARPWRQMRPASPAPATTLRT